KETEGTLHMVFNPPYGERLDIDLERFYREIGDTLKQSYPDTNAWFITGNIEALKYVGLKPSRKIKMFNGKLEARLLKYEMYKENKRTKFQNKIEFEYCNKSFCYTVFIFCSYFFSCTLHYCSF